MVLSSSSSKSYLAKLLGSAARSDLNQGKSEIMEYGAPSTTPERRQMNSAAAAEAMTGQHAAFCGQDVNVRLSLLAEKHWTSSGHGILLILCFH